MDETAEAPSTGSILIVDDTPANLRLLSGMLKDHGYRVRPAPNGRLALQAAEKEPPDLILLDINMPDMDGYEVCQRLKSDENLAGIPVIFISALSETMDKVKAFDSGGVDYVTKPFQFEEVLARVEAHLTLRRLQLELEGMNEVLEARVRERTAELATLNEAYERFVPREFLSCLEKESIVEVGLGNQVLREMTVAFTDIRDFTSISEKMDPQENFDFMNTYLGRVTPLIRQNGGFVDKYIGDAVMALYPGTADNAVKAAVAMAREVTAFSEEMKAAGRPPIRTGTGLHTGNLMLGIVGADDRFDATVIADAVNLASRLDSLTKLYGSPILISEQTLAAMDDPEEYQVRFLGAVQVKGKEVPVKVFEVFDADPDPLREKKADTNPGFQEGLELYFQKRFAEAAVQFNMALQALPDDKAYQLYLKRAAHFLGQGAPEGWTGVEMMTEK